MVFNIFQKINQKPHILAKNIKEHAKNYHEKKAKNYHESISHNLDIVH